MKQEKLKPGDVVRWIGKTDRRRKHTLFVVDKVIRASGYAWDILGASWCLLSTYRITLLRMDGLPYTLRPSNDIEMHIFTADCFAKDAFLTSVHKRKKGKLCSNPDPSDGSTNPK